ncbi:MAG: PatA/PatG family cyanobactin maturation protease [Terriglobia bacterium]
MVSAAATNVTTIPGLPELWAKTLGDPRICIAILDSPVDVTHPSLAGANLTQIETLVSSEAASGLGADHGTHVASVIFGRHDSPIKGIAPQCRGLIAPIFKDVVSGSPVLCSQVDLARALLQVVQAGANVINVSGGQFSPSGTAHPILADAVRSCVQSGALIVAAAGNQGCDCLHIPGALPSVLAVGAMNARGEPLPFSNWGGAYQFQGILAPGQNILGARPGGGIATDSGTSYATAVVSGVAALMLSVQLKLGKKPNGDSVRAALLRSASGRCEIQRASDCRRLLAGRLNVRGAISILTSRGRNMADPTMPTDAPPDITDPENLLEEEQELPESSQVYPSASQRSVSVSRPASTVVARSNEVLPQNRASRTGLIAPSACGCGGESGSQLVYALGQLGFDFGTEARRDAFVQNMDDPASGGAADPHDANQLLNYLQNNPWDAASLIWTLSLEGTVVYAVAPQGPFASEAYKLLRQFLEEQRTKGAERVSIPGIISGSVRLFNGQVVPVIRPEIRGMCNWTTAALVQAVAGATPPESAPPAEQQAYSDKIEGVRSFLERLYYELRNLGITPQERAMNYAGTNAFHIEMVFESTMKEPEDMDLESIEVEHSPVCRPDSDCWDVKLHFFFPARQVQTVRKVYRFTVDVSDVVPVTVGPVRSWFVR